jgi:LAO/AO transport system kinase
MKRSPKAWRPPVVQTVATRGNGVSELSERIFEHRKFLSEGNGLRQKRLDRIRDEVTGLIEHEISRCIHKMVRTDGQFEDSIEQIQGRKKDPYSYAQELTEPLLQYCRTYKADRTPA